MRFRHQRFPADTFLRLMYHDEILGGAIVNISTTGARLEGLSRMPEGVIVHLCYLHTRIPARVVWSNNTQTGVQFVRPLSGEDLDALRRAGGRPGGNWGSQSHFAPREL